jgi:putative transposase
MEKDNFGVKDIRNQLQEDIASDQISMKEFIDPFTGEQENKGKNK